MKPFIFVYFMSFSRIQFSYCEDEYFQNDFISFVNFQFSFLSLCMQAFWRQFWLQHSAFVHTQSRRPSRPLYVFTRCLARLKYTKAQCRDGKESTERFWAQSHQRIPDRRVRDWGREEQLAGCLAVYLVDPALSQVFVQYEKLVVVLFSKTGNRL